MEAETYASSIFGGHQHVSPKSRLDLGLLLVALRLALKCVAVDQVISRMKIVAPGGSRLGGRCTYRRHTDKDKKTDGNSDNQSRAWAGVMQSLLALDQEASKVLKSRRG